MKKNDTQAFVNQLLIYVLVTICFGGSIGLGTVWMRHQISVTANTNRQLAKRIAEVNRHWIELKSQVAEEQDLEVLKSRNATWRLGLERVSDKQVVRVTGDPVTRLAVDRNRDLRLTDRALPVISFKVALKN